MLSDIIKQSSGWDTKALAKIFSNKEFPRSTDGGEGRYKNYLVDIVSDYLSEEVILPKEIIPNSVTLHAFVFAYRKDPLILPILLKYFTHKNLLQEAKDDLDELNQRLQNVMGEDLQKLRDNEKKLQDDQTKLSSVKINSVDVKVNAIAEIDNKIRRTLFEIEQLESRKEETETFLKGSESMLDHYPKQYFSILESELTKIMEKKLTAYVKDNTDIEETYSSLNSKAKKIIILEGVESLAKCVSIISFILTPGVQFLVGTISTTVKVSPQYSVYAAAIMASVGAISLTIAGIAHLVNRSHEQSLVKEMENFIEKPILGKETNTENGKPSLKGEPVRDINERNSSFSTLTIQQGVKNGLNHR